MQSHLIEILKQRSPEMVALIPTTPQEIADAKERLSRKDCICGICQDLKFVYYRDGTGKVDYTRTIPCQCVRKQADENKKTRLLKYCEMPVKGQSMTFNTFDVSPANREAYEACLSFVNGEDDYTFLTLLGPSTRGKTHLLCSICNWRLEKNELAKYAFVPLLLDELREGFKNKGDESFSSRYNVFKTVPMLALDDLGTENSTPWVQEKLDTLFDYRLMNQLKTVVTTNLPLSQLPFRIAHRLDRDGLVINMDIPKYKRGKANG